MAMIDGAWLRQHLMDANGRAVNRVNLAYRDGSIDSGQEFALAHYQRGITEAIKLIDMITPTGEEPPYIPHLCKQCGTEVFTNDGGKTWWDGSTGLTACGSNDLHSVSDLP